MLRIPIGLMAVVTLPAFAQPLANPSISGPPSRAGGTRATTSGHVQDAKPQRLNDNVGTRAMPADPRSIGNPRHETDWRSITQQRRELDDLRREDVASQLALLGVAVKWQDHTLAELVDWRDRIEAAVTLRVQYRVDVDWRVTSLRDLIDMRLRASKASELASVHGVLVDWRRYSWVALEGMRRQMQRARPDNSTAALAADALATPGSAGRPRRPGVRPKDPDAIIEPTFAFDTTLVWARPFGRRARPDPDAILVPTFVTVPSPPIGPNDVIDPWETNRRFLNGP